MTDLIDDPAAQAVRRPPQSINSEQSILGGLMIDNNALDSIVDIIQPDDFYRRDHKIIYEHIAAMIQRGRPADSLTVAESLRDAGLDTDTGGFAYLAELVNNTPSAANIRRYAEIVHDKSVLRQLISAGDHMVTCALQPEGRETAQILDEAERIVLAINERNSRGQRGFQPMATLVREVSEKIIDLYQNQQGSEVTGVPTGYPNLDRELAGLQRGDLIIIAGRPSMGKTSFAINIAENVGVRQELPVAVFSLEMGGDQLAQRLISSVANIDAQKLRKAQLEDEEWNAFSKAVHRLENKPIYIDDTPALMISELSSRARRLVNQTGPLGLIVVDYIQLMTAVPASTTARPNCLKFHAASRRWQRSCTARSSCSRSSTALLNSEPTSARSCPTFANPAQSNRTPTSSCSFIARSSTTRTLLTRILPRSSSPSSVTVQSVRSAWSSAAATPASSPGQAMSAIGKAHSNLKRNFECSTGLHK